MFFATACGKRNGFRFSEHRIRDDESGYGQKGMTLYDINIFLDFNFRLFGQLIIYISINAISENLFSVVLVRKMAHLDTLLMSLS